MSSTDSSAGMAMVPFDYLGHRFECGAERQPSGDYQGVVWHLGPAPGVRTQLPRDADPYSTEAEALRHAQQQAVRWTHDRTGDGQGRF
ncbi:MAG: hypothetical protein EOO22_01870 [Comamonadaceae bacterium]|nr:MAG: hypothetical protein EOO22_01870 [Comamonadaceae bacterium]